MLYNSRKQIQEQNWTTEQLIRMSANLAQAYCSGMSRLTEEVSTSEQAKSQGWNTQKLLDLGNKLTAGFGGTVTRS
jgi:hypothetical protein